MDDLPGQFPTGTEFPKLRESGNPYRCDGWRHDTHGNCCMYYEFSGQKRRYKKRVLRSEIEAASGHLKAGNIFNRSAFELLCPVSCRDGYCGFAVIGRILEQTLGARYDGRNGFVPPG